VCFFAVAAHVDSHARVASSGEGAAASVGAEDNDDDCVEATQLLPQATSTPPMKTRGARTVSVFALAMQRGAPAAPSTQPTSTPVPMTDSALEQRGSRVLAPDSPDNSDAVVTRVADTPPTHADAAVDGNGSDAGADVGDVGAAAAADGGGAGDHVAAATADATLVREDTVTPVRVCIC